MCHTNCPKKVVKMIDSSPKCNFSLISVKQTQTTEDKVMETAATPEVVTWQRG